MALMIQFWILDSCGREFGVVEKLAALVAVGTWALTVWQQVGLSSVAESAAIEAGLVAEADVRQTHAAVLAVVLRATACALRNGWQSSAAFQTVFGDRIFKFWILIFDWGTRLALSLRRWRSVGKSGVHGLGSFGAARA
jgi:hypothetical protein